ncbi:uncharacterized protein [Rutidosis leptorrhynchoides]|uniref:uncharacterized protein n=1 Tax=Rutidosis leptorrhynchoides TaxID=125765 RepID=UPI003A9A18C3
MGKGWFSALKKAITPSCTKFKKSKRSRKSKSKSKRLWFGNQMRFNMCLSRRQATLGYPPQNYSSKDKTELKHLENEQIKQVDPVSYVSHTTAKKRERAFHKERGFDLSPESKEQVEARLQNEKDAAERRKRALAYAFSRQRAWRNAQKSANSTVVNRNSPDWNWIWSKRCNLKVSMKPVISKSGPSPSGSRKKGSLSTKYGAVFTRKPNLVSNLASSVGKRSLGAHKKKNSKTLRWE